MFSCHSKRRCLINISVQAFVRSAAHNQEARNTDNIILSQLLATPAGNLLKQPGSTEIINTKLFEFLILWNKPTTFPDDLYPFCEEIVQKIVSKSPDLEIWTAVFDLLSAFSRPRTPPGVVSLKSSAHQTPIRISSGSVMTEDDTRDRIDPLIRSELRGVMFKDVEGVFDTFFGKDRWAEIAGRLHEDLPIWPLDPSQDSAVEWFRSFSRIVKGSTSFYSSANQPLTGSKCSRKCDVFLSPAVGDENANEGEPSRDHRFAWQQVLVPGELKSNPDKDMSLDSVVQLGGYVREVFGAQPSRRFVHAFQISGDIMRCFIFDRAGGFCTTGIRFRDEPKKFIQVLVGYSHMDATELGFDPTIQTPSGDTYEPSITKSTKVVVHAGQQLILNPEPIFYTSAIVSRATTIRLAVMEDGRECVVKDSWRSSKRKSEGEFFERAKRRRVEGLADCSFFEDVMVNGERDEIHKNVRKGLDFPPLNARSFPDQERGSWSSGQIGPASGRAQEESRSRSKASRSKEMPSQAPTGQAGTSASHKHQRSETSFETGQPSTKSFKSSEKATVYSWDRIHSRLVLRTIGRPIYAFRSILEFLETFRDAIIAHRSLVMDGQILHRDISINNVMINEDRSAKFRGFLIDLDLAKDLSEESDDENEGPPHRTGTIEFMAVEVLQQSAMHSYRHDLESFFYVFIWICTFYDKNGRVRCPRPTTLDGWSRVDAVGDKLGKMSTKNSFEMILAGFSNDFEGMKATARDMRKVLFPLIGDDVFTGTYEDKRIMYKGVLLAVDRGLQQLNAQQ